MTNTRKNEWTRFGDWNNHSWRDQSYQSHVAHPMHVRVTKHVDGTTWIALRHSEDQEQVEVLLDEEAQAWLIQEILFGKVGDNDEA